jgi:hypothetical protein
MFTEQNLPFTQHTLHSNKRAEYEVPISAIFLEVYTTSRIQNKCKSADKI